MKEKEVLVLVVPRVEDMIHIIHLKEDIHLHLTVTENESLTPDHTVVVIHTEENITLLILIVVEKVIVVLVPAMIMVDMILLTHTIQGLHLLGMLSMQLKGRELHMADHHIRGPLYHAVMNHHQQ